MKFLHHIHLIFKLAYMTETVDKYYFFCTEEKVQKLCNMIIEDYKAAGYHLVSKTIL